MPLNVRGLFFGMFLLTPGCCPAWGQFDFPPPDPEGLPVKTVTRVGRITEISDARGDPAYVLTSGGVDYRLIPDLGMVGALAKDMHRLAGHAVQVRCRPGEVRAGRLRILLIRSVRREPPPGHPARRSHGFSSAGVKAVASASQAAERLE